MYNYTSADVGDQRLQSIFCRGCSELESIDINHKLIVFFIHNKNIYSWMNSTDREQEKHSYTAKDRKPIPLKHLG